MDFRVWLLVICVAAALGCGEVGFGGAPQQKDMIVDFTADPDFNCDDVLAEKIARVSAVETENEMNLAVAVVQATEHYCESMEWSPVVSDVYPGMSCANREAVEEGFWEELAGLPDDVRVWLMGGSPEGGVRLESGRGPGGVVLVHFTDGTEGAHHPSSDGALCWVIKADGGRIAGYSAF